MIDQTFLVLSWHQTLYRNGKMEFLNIIVFTREERKHSRAEYWKSTIKLIFLTLTEFIFKQYILYELLIQFLCTFGYFDKLHIDGRNIKWWEGKGRIFMISVCCCGKSPSASPWCRCLASAGHTGKPSGHRETAGGSWHPAWLVDGCEGGEIYYLLVTGLSTARLYKHLTRPLRASVCTAWWACSAIERRNQTKLNIQTPVPEYQ